MLGYFLGLKLLSVFNCLLCSHLIKFKEEKNEIKIQCICLIAILGYFRDSLPWYDLSLGFINQKNVIEKESYIEKTKKYVEYSLVFVKQNKMSFCLLRDITIHKEYEKQLNQNQKELINTTNSVIEKQMRVVQEIASLLGETTAETKVALIKLRDQFVNKDGE